MSDPISGDAIKQVSNVGNQIQQQEDLKKSSDPAKFDALMDQQDGAANDQRVKEILTNPAGEVDRVPHTEKVRLQREIETRVIRMDRADQVQYFATPAHETEKALYSLRENAPKLPESNEKNQLMETIDHLEAWGKESKQFLADFQAGRQFTNQELLAYQVKSQANGEMSKILQKSVELGVSGMKTIFQTNV